MTDLNGCRILLGVTGGIAAYKAAVLARGLIAAGATVRVVMSAGARAFVQPLTFQALTGHPVHTDLLDEAAEAAMGHIELARWADLVLIAPASANTLARLAHGLAEDLLGTLCLATDAPLVVAPAMNRLMWAHPATRANCATLAGRGVRFIGPASGDQACGEVGAGRFEEPERIVEALRARAPDDALNDALNDALDGALDDPSGHAPGDTLAGRHVLLTAGPTREPIDPVRYIGNRSSGRMGFAIAAEAARRGAEVTLVSGPVALPTPAGVGRIDVESAQDMHEEVMRLAPSSDLFIAVAAVSDYRVVERSAHKLKKDGEPLTLSLLANPDILADVAASEPRPFCVGFAAETERLEEHARLKLADKRLDLIAGNRVADANAPVFGSDDNAVELYWADGGHRSLPRAPKPDIARALLDTVIERLAATGADR